MPKDPFKLASGRSLDAHERIIGLTADGELEVYGGYDGRLHAHDHCRLTQAELVEVADVMISRWTEAKARWSAGELPESDEDGFWENLA